MERKNWAVGGLGFRKIRERDERRKRRQSHKEDYLNKKRGMKAVASQRTMERSPEICRCWQRHFRGLLVTLCGGYHVYTNAQLWFFLILRLGHFLFIFSSTMGWRLRSSNTWRLFLVRVPKLVSPQPRYDITRRQVRFLNVTWPFPSGDGKTDNVHLQSTNNFTLNGHN